MHDEEEQWGLPPWRAPGRAPKTRTIYLFVPVCKGLNAALGRRLVSTDSRLSEVIAIAGPGRTTAERHKR